MMRAFLLLSTVFFFSFLLIGCFEESGVMTRKEAEKIIKNELKVGVTCEEIEEFLKENN